MSKKQEYDVSKDQKSGGEKLPTFPAYPKGQSAEQVQEFLKRENAKAAAVPEFKPDHK